MRSSYYDEELEYIRELAREFGETHPEASHLVEKGQDPDVERLLEGFAFLAAQVRETLDDDFPELTHGLFNLLWPSYLRPVPSMAIEQFDPKPGALRQPVLVAKGAEVASQESTPALKFRFRTCWDMTLLPVNVDSAAIEVTRRGRASLLLKFTLQPNVNFDKMELDTLRLYLDDESQPVWNLYYHLMRRVEDATAWGDTDPRPVPVRVSPVGFAREEAVLPHPPGVPNGNRLMQEYFVFPQKFAFFDVSGLKALAGERVKGSFQVRFEFDEEADPRLRVTTNDVRLNCVPIVNLFDYESEPVPIENTRSRFPIRPKGREQSRLDIYSVDGMNVRGVDKTDQAVPWFYSFSPDVFREKPVYFTVRRQLSPRSTSIAGRTTQPEAQGSQAFVTWITLVEASGAQRPIGEGTATFPVTCTNGRLAGSLDRRQLTANTDTSPVGANFRNITVPTPQVEPPQRIGALWRLLSLMSLNHLSLDSGDTLRLTLELMAAINAGAPMPNESATVVGGLGEKETRDIRLRIRGIRDVQAKAIERIHGGGMIRGTRLGVNVRLDAFGDVGRVFLFGSVLDEFIAGHASINSFTQLELRFDDSRLPLAWPPRIGRERL